MNVEDIRDYALSLPETEEGMPFGETVVVFRTAGKIFLLLSLNDEPLQFNVKCDPDRALELRESYDAIIPGFHMNKKHWNTLLLSGDLKLSLIKELIDHSYNLVVAGLTKKQKEDLLSAK